MKNQMNQSHNLHITSDTPLFATPHCNIKFNYYVASIKPAHWVTSVLILYLAAAILVSTIRLHGISIKSMEDTVNVGIR